MRSPPGRRRQRGGPRRRQGAPRPLPARRHGAGAVHGRVRPDRLLGPRGARGRAAGAARAARPAPTATTGGSPARIAFAQVEVGEIDRALATIERSLALYPRNANGAHIRAHVYYEAGERAAGLAYLEDWWRDYPKESLLHCHISWHIALWRMELGRTAGGLELLPRASAPRRLHRAAAQHADRLRLLPVPRGDGGRGARPRAVARAQPLRHAVVPLARHRLRRRARRAGACVRRRCRRAGQDHRRRQGSGARRRGADRARLPRLRPLGLDRGRAAAGGRARPRTSASAAAAPSATSSNTRSSSPCCGPAASTRPAACCRRAAWQSGAGGWPIEGI